jgi:hypothetical protein
MKNLTDYNDFKNKKHLTESVQEVVTEEVTVSVEDNEVYEGAQLFDATWKVRTRVEIPTSLLNAYIKKVKDESGEDVRKKWSEQELAEEITKYVTTSYLTIENLPTTIVSNASSEPKVQTQEEMPVETQVQAPVQAEEPVNVQVETEAPAQGAQAVAQTVPQAQKPAQGGQAQAPAQSI